MARKSSFLILFLLTCCSLLFAQETRLGAAPEWLISIRPDLSKKPDQSKVSDGYYLELIDNQVHLENQTAYTHYIRHIMSETGVQHASEVSVRFSPAYERVIFHKVALIRGGNIINHLTASQIKVVQEEEDAADYLYNGEKRAFIVLKDVRAGDKIEVSYSITGFNPVFANRYGNTIYFTRGTAVCNYFETIIAAAGRKLHFQCKNGAVAPTVQEKNGVQIYSWSNPVISQWEDQPGVPSWFDSYPFVSITEYNNWKEVTDWGLSILEHYNYTLPEELNRKIISWRAQSKGDNGVFCRLAIQFVQDKIRYLGMEMGVNTHKPYSPEQVFRQRYGDCKDKALLLAMILRNEKIPAYVALVNTQLRSTVKDVVPSSSAFNHAIVAIEQPSGWRYVDATSSSQRGDVAVRYIPAYGAALIIKEHNTSLTAVIPGPTNRMVITEKLIVGDIHKDSSFLEVVSSYEGGGADNIRSSLAESSLSETEESYLKYYTKIFPGIKKDKDILITDDSIVNKITLQERYVIPELWDTEDNKEKFDVFANGVYSYLPNDPAKLVKALPQALSYPRDVSYTMEVYMPEEWGFSATAVHVKNDSYAYDFTPIVNDRIITLQYHFVTFKDHIPAEEFAQFKADYKKISRTFDFEISRDTNLSEQSVSAEYPASSSDTYYKAIWFSVIFLLLLLPLYRHLNRREEPVFFSGVTRPIRGWTAFLGVCIGMGVLGQLFNLFNSGLFSSTTWIAIFNAGGNELENLFYVELGIYLFWSANAIVLLYWFVRKRDIFPKMFIAYVLSLIVGQLVLMLISERIPKYFFETSTGGDMWTAFARTVIFGVIWIRYILRSDDPRNTFTRNFREEDYSSGGKQEQNDNNQTT